MHGASVRPFSLAYLGHHMIPVAYCAALLAMMVMLHAAALLLTRTPILAHSVSNFLINQVHINDGPPPSDWIIILIWGN
jgi:hypothetical protein